VLQINKSNLYSTLFRENLCLYKIYLLAMFVPTRQVLLINDHVSLSLTSWDCLVTGHNCWLWVIRYKWINGVVRCAFGYYVQEDDCDEEYEGAPLDCAWLYLPSICVLSSYMQHVASLPQAWNRLLCRLFTASKWTPVHNFWSLHCHFSCLIFSLLLVCVRVHF